MGGNTGDTLMNCCDDDIFIPQSPPPTRLEIVGTNPRADLSTMTVEWLRDIFTATFEHADRITITAFTVNNQPLSQPTLEPRTRWRE